MIARLRAVLTPWTLAVLISMLAAVFLIRSQTEDTEAAALENRVSETLSAMAGAGEVKVVIAYRTAAAQPSSLSGFQSVAQEPTPSGAVAVVQGADDPLIRAQMIDALCALLGLPASAVSVIAGGG